jgi:mevalonate kinase
MQELYPSKLMIFGEYAVLAGGEGLAIPWDDFVLVWIEDAETPSAFSAICTMAG